MSVVASTSVQNLQNELREVKGRVERIEQQMRVHVQSQQAATRETVAQYTRELFGGEVEVTDEEDPEIADCHFVVFNAIANGNDEEIIAKDHEWHRWLCQFEPADVTGFVLSVTAAD